MYHMVGDITTITDSSFRTILEQTFPILAAHPNAPKTILPAPPRHLFNGCCQNTNHSCNIGAPNHAKELLGRAQHLGTILTKMVISCGLQHCRVMDTCYMIEDGGDNPTLYTTWRLCQGQCTRHQDGVHDNCGE